MKVKDKLDGISDRKVVTLLAEDTVQAALDVMCEANIGSIVITDDAQRVVGIVTERDMMRRVLWPAKDPKTTALSAVMSSNVKVAHERDDLLDWLQVMSHERFRRLPVVGDDGKLVNILSQGDFVAYTFHDLYEKVRQDLKGRLGRTFQVALVIAACVTLGLIALGL